MPCCRNRCRSRCGADTPVCRTAPNPQSVPGPYFTHVGHHFLDLGLEWYPHKEVTNGFQRELKKRKDQVQPCQHGQDENDAFHEQTSSSDGGLSPREGKTSRWGNEKRAIQNGSMSGTSSNAGPVAVAGLPLPLPVRLPRTASEASSSDGRLPSIFISLARISTT